MTLLLIRHARAGNRQRWVGDDNLRPLSPRGARQAKGLVAALQPFRLARVEQVVASPSLRCVLTVEPLAEHLGLEVEPADELSEGRASDAVGLIRTWAKRDVAACSHGDVIPVLLRALVPDLGEDLPCAKGSTWVLEPDGGDLRARYVPPPD